MTYSSCEKMLKRLSIILIILLVPVYSIFVERYIITVREETLRFRNLPMEFDGFRIVQLSDIHYGFLTPRFWIESVFNRVRGMDRDIICLTGDYVKKRNCREEIREIWPMMEELSAPLGVFMVLGNHDHWADSSLSMEYLEKSGRSVRFRHRLIRRGKAVIAIAGAGDHWEDESGIDRALAGVPDGVFRIVLAHNPDTSDGPHRSRVDLYLCGHTHGGQFIIPFREYAPVLPVSNKDYSSGVKRNNRGETLFISRGLGWSILPVRLNCFPEINVITLRRSM